MLNTLNLFLNSCLVSTQYASAELCNLLKHQAFGAVQFFELEHPELDTQARDLWMETYLPQFNKVIEEKA